MNYINSITEAIGHTPLLKLNRVGKDAGANVFVKLEHLNPSGSYKDRMALAMVEAAERGDTWNHKQLKEGGTVIEASAGNTAPAVSMVCAAKGYDAHIYLYRYQMEDPKNARLQITKAFGPTVKISSEPSVYLSEEQIAELSKTAPDLLHVLAAKMGMDPFDIRELNCYKESAGSTIPTGYAPDVYCLEEMYKKARPLYEAAKKRVAEKNAASDGRYKYGIGVSSGVYGCGLDGVDSSQAYAELNPDGTVTMYACWEDHGQGADMGVLQSAHETLRQIGIKPEQIKLVMNDTKLAPNSGPAGGSRSQVMSGNACRLAAENLIAAMKREDGTLRTYDEMVAEGIETKVLGNWVTDYCATHPVDQATSQGEPFATYMYTLFLPEVRVDTQTGKVKVEKFTCVADVGTILNKLLVDGNFYGGLAQGIGLALTEDFEDLSKHTSLLKCGSPYPGLIF